MEYITITCTLDQFIAKNKLFTCLDNTKASQNIQKHLDFRTKSSYLDPNHSCIGVFVELVDWHTTMTASYTTYGLGYIHDTNNTITHLLNLKFTSHILLALSCNLYTIITITKRIVILIGRAFMIKMKPILGLRRLIQIQGSHLVSCLKAL